MKNARFVPVSSENTNWTKRVHTAFHNLSRQNKTLKPLLFCRNLGFVAKQQTPVLDPKKKKNKKHKLATLVFSCKERLGLKSQLVRKTLLFCEFWGFLFSFVNPFFLLLLFGGRFFLVLVSNLLLLVVVFKDKVSMFWLLLHVGFWFLWLHYIFDLVVFFLFLGGLQGSRDSLWATSLGPKPSLFVLVCCLFFFEGGQNLFFL